MRLFQSILLLIFPVTIVVALSLLTKPISLTNAATNPAKLSKDDEFYSYFDTIRTNLSDYIWPTDASNRITSSFAEFRPTHFHAGIDISTNSRIGYKVFAVRDGYVYRIRTMPNSYGKMIYLKHYDGYYSTYSHLDRFNDIITEIVRKEQYEKGVYSIDLILEENQISVKKGDVIAYTGESGVGPPHLHFEIRDENLNPINPLLFENFNYEDNIPPKIKRLIINPLDAYSTVEKKFEPKYISKFSYVKNKSIIPQNLLFHGKIGLGIDAIDLNDGTWSRSGIHRMELYINDSLTFSIILDRIPANETKQILLYYDLPSYVSGKGRFQKLYREVGNTLPFYDYRPVGSGIINTEIMPEGLHRFSIVCKDFNGNQTQLEGKFIVNHRPSISFVEINDSKIVLNAQNLSSVTDCFIMWKKIGAPSWNKRVLSEKEFIAEESKLILPFVPSQYDVMKLTAETRNGICSAPVFYFKTKSYIEERKIEAEIELKRTFAQITLKTPGFFTLPPQVTISNGYVTKSILFEALDIHTYKGFFIPTDSLAGKNSMEVVAEINGHKVEKSFPLNFFVIPAHYSGYIKLDDKNLKVSYDSGAVYSPILLTIKNNASSFYPHYSLEPIDVPLNRGIKFSITVPKNAPENKLGLYAKFNRGWVFQNADVDISNNTISTILQRTLGELAILQDDIPPTIGGLKIRKQKGRVFIKFRYHDNLSGVDPDKIKLYINNTLVIPEIDGEHKRVWYESSGQIGLGKNIINISISDYAGNTTQIHRAVN